MKRSTFSDVQIAGIPRGQEAGSPTAEIWRRHGLSSATFGGMEESDAKLPAGRRTSSMSSLACGRRLRVFNLADDVAKECLAAVADTSVPGQRVAMEPTALVERRGKPGLFVSDHRTRFASNARLA